MAGMAVALVATVALAVDRDIEGRGSRAARRRRWSSAPRSACGAPAVVEMTGMPELIALLHSFVGLAAVLVGWNGYLLVEGDPSGHEAQPLEAVGTLGIHHVEVVIGVFIGAVTFTGSIVAFLKLSARISSSPADAARQEPAQPRRPGRVRRAHDRGSSRDPSCRLLVVVTLVALALGWHLVASIGGGDMPVVVSMLNSYSGWAAAASGFLLENDLLIITGALVGVLGCLPVATSCARR